MYLVVSEIGRAQTKRSEIDEASASLSLSLSVALVSSFVCVSEADCFLLHR